MLNIKPASWASSLLAETKIKRRLKYLIRVWVAKKHSPPFLEVLSRSPALKQFHAKKPTFFAAVLHTHLDSKLKMSIRFENACNDILKAQKIFGEVLLSRMLKGENIFLCRINDDLNVRFGLNTLSQLEGFWRVFLEDGSGRMVYTLTFAFAPNESACIGSVQGMFREHEETAQSMIKHLSKICHGLRPVNLMLEMFRMTCNSLGIKHLNAIGQRNHPKGPRWHKAGRLKFNYDTFWAEVGAVRQANGNWFLPVNKTYKALDSIPSKKRAMYKRRYDLLNHCAKNIRLLSKPTKRMISRLQ